MPSLKERVSTRVARFRARHPKVDHVLAMAAHYGKVDGNAQAGAVTFFGFLSFFPILALAFFGVGLLAHVFPELRADIRAEIGNLLPGVVGGGQGEIPLKTFEDYGATVGGIGLVAVLYSGLGWLSGMRTALKTVFMLPPGEQPNFVFGKLRDVATLLLIGVTMVVSVALSGLVAGFSESMLGWVGIGSDGVLPHVVLWVVSHGLAIGASTALLLTLFTLLAQPRVPRRSLLDGAILGAVGFEVLKGIAYFLIAQTKAQPAFQAFGVALVLVVWINYFSRLVLYAASYAYTSPAAARRRQAEAVAVAAESPPVDPVDHAVSVDVPVAVDVPVPVAAADPGTEAGPARGAEVAVPRARPVLGAAAVFAAGVAAFAAWRRGRMAR